MSCVTGIDASQPIAKSAVRIGISHVRGAQRFQSMRVCVLAHVQQNLLVAAPTGAGKTNVALMVRACERWVIACETRALQTILRELGRHRIDGRVERCACECARDHKRRARPATRARSSTWRRSRRWPPKWCARSRRVSIRSASRHVVAHEIVMTWLACAGGRTDWRHAVDETGVARDARASAVCAHAITWCAQMIITTPEKWDVITRKSNDQVRHSHWFSRSPDRAHRC
jgi:hypothetical protein